MESRRVWEMTPRRLLEERISVFDAASYKHVGKRLA
jgi:hypothetical protein